MKVFKTSGTCAKEIKLEAKEGILTKVDFVGGCSGNLKGIKALVEGMKIEDVVEKLEDITCGNKNSSCPSELVKGLKKFYL